eukprot:2781402-Rhodomonas_salina.2
MSGLRPASTQVAASPSARSMLIKIVFCMVRFGVVDVEDGGLASIVLFSLISGRTKILKSFDSVVKTFSALPSSAATCLRYHGYY